MILVPVSRNDIFRSSAFADNFIAEMQQSYAAHIDVSVRWEAKMLERYYDHLQPFEPMNEPISGHCVLAYAAKSKKDYIENLPLLLQRFYSALTIEQLYLMDFNKTPLLQFPFENFRKLNRFKRMANTKRDDVGFILDIGSLTTILPLFLFSGRYDGPNVLLITATGEMPLSVRLCDDGNFHLNYQKQYDAQVKTAAKNAGLVMGDLELCVAYRIK